MISTPLKIFYMRAVNMEREMKVQKMPPYLMAIPVADLATMMMIFEGAGIFPFSKVSGDAEVVVLLVFAAMVVVLVCGRCETWKYR